MWRATLILSTTLSAITLSTAVRVAGCFIPSTMQLTTAAADKSGCCPSQELFPSPQPAYDPLSFSWMPPELASSVSIAGWWRSRRERRRRERRRRRSASLPLATPGQWLQVSLHVVLGSFMLLLVAQLPGARPLCCGTRSVVL